MCQQLKEGTLAAELAATSGGGGGPRPSMARLNNLLMQLRKVGVAPAYHSYKHCDEHVHEQARATCNCCSALACL